MGGRRGLPRIWWTILGSSTPSFHSRAVCASLCERKEFQMNRLAKALAIASVPSGITAAVLILGSGGGAAPTLARLASSTSQAQVVAVAPASPSDGPAANGSAGPTGASLPPPSNSPQPTYVTVHVIRNGYNFTIHATPTRTTSVVNGATVETVTVSAPAVGNAVTSYVTSHPALATAPLP
jgi:hypothetical protein